MNWNLQKSSMLSTVLVCFFAFLLLLIDITCPWFVSFLANHTELVETRFGNIPLTLTIYLCSIPAWVTLWSLRRILLRIRNGDIFTEENTQDMRRTSWCCMAVAMICLFAAIFYPTLLVVAAAAAFMGLIVRIVRDSFRQAVAMKDELDFTI